MIVVDLAPLGRLRLAAILRVGTARVELSPTAGLSGSEFRLQA